MTDELNRAIKELDNKVDEVRLEIAALIALSKELKEEVHSMSSLPVRIECVSTRLETAEGEIRSIRSKSWTLIVMVIGSLIAAAGSVTVTMLTG